MLAFYPILSAYGFSPQADFGVILLFLIGTLCVFIIGPRFRYRFPDGYALFLCFALLFTLFFAHSIPVRLLLYSVNLCIACNYVDYKLLKKYYSFLVIFCCSFFIIQEIVAFLSNVHLVGIVSFLPTIYADRDDIDIIDSLANSARHSSLFLEPSYFAQYLFPYIVLMLFEENSRHGIQKAVIVSIIVLFSRSGIGAVLLLIIWTAWLLAGSLKMKTKILLLLLGSIFIVLLFRYSGGLFTDMLERTSEFQSFRGDEQFMSSGFIRFFQGYYAYADMPLINKLFGANPKLVASVAHSNIFFASDGSVSFNGTQTLLMYNGLFVCILYFRHLILMCRKKHSIALSVMVICCIWLMLGEYYYLCSRMFMTTVLMYALAKESMTSGQQSMIEGNMIIRYQTKVVD